MMGFLSACQPQQPQPQETVNTEITTGKEMKAQSEIVTVVEQFIAGDKSPREIADSLGKDADYSVPDSLTFQLSTNNNITAQLILTGEKFTESESMYLRIKDSEKLTLADAEVLFGKSSPDTPPPEGNPYVFRFPTYAKPGFKSIGHVYASMNDDIDRNQNSVVIEINVVKEKTPR